VPLPRASVAARPNWRTSHCPANWTAKIRSSLAPAAASLGVRSARQAVAATMLAVTPPSISRRSMDPVKAFPAEVTDKGTKLRLAAAPHSSMVDATCTLMARW